MPKKKKKDISQKYKTQEEIDDMENQMELEKADGGGEDEGGMQWNEFKPDEKKPDLKVISG